MKRFLFSPRETAPLAFPLLRLLLQKCFLSCYLSYLPDALPALFRPLIGASWNLQPISTHNLLCLPSLPPSLLPSPKSSPLRTHWNRQPKIPRRSKLASSESGQEASFSSSSSLSLLLLRFPSSSSPSLEKGQDGRLLLQYNWLRNYSCLRSGLPAHVEWKCNVRQRRQRSLKRCFFWPKCGCACV